MNDDIIKDPIRPGAIPPQPAKDNKTALIIIIVIVVVLFLLPLIMFLGIMLLIFSSLDGMSYVSPERNTGGDLAMTAEQSRTFKSVYILNDAGMLARNGISRQDCINMYDAAVDYYDYDSGDMDGFDWLPMSYCNGEYVNISLENSDDYYTIYLYDDKTCLSYQISSDHSTLEKYVYGSMSPYCSEGVKAPIIDDGSIDEGGDDDIYDAPFIQNPSKPQTKTNAV